MVPLYSTTPLILHHILLCNKPWVVDLPEVTSGENKGSTKHTIKNFIFLDLKWLSLSAMSCSSPLNIHSKGLSWTR